MKKHLILLVLLMTTSVMFTGCGETVRGAWKDAQRVGHGVKTIFVAE